MALYNRVKVAITAGGAGNLTIGAPAAMYRGFGDAGIPDGTVVSYVIEDASNSRWEYGRGTYTAPSTFARTTVLATSAGNTTPINAPSSAFLFIDALAEDFVATVGIGSTPIAGGTSGRVLFNNGGNIGEASNLTYDGTDTTASGIKLKAATSGLISLKASPSTTNYTITFPNAVATKAGQSLTSDTSGNLSWTSEVAANMQFAASSRVLGRNTTGAGSGEELTASQVLDWLGASQGQVLYRSSTGWTALATGNVGQYLRTEGASANPAWADLPPYGVTPFSATATYNANDVVSNAGKLYSAKAAIPAGAFNAANWTEIGAPQTFTATRVPFAGATGILTDDAGMTFDATSDKLTLAGDAIINGMTVGRGSGNSASNTVLGFAALAATTSGGNNVAVGVQALQNNKTGGNNIAIGVAALSSNTDGTNNTALGVLGQSKNVNGSNNASFGTAALQNNISGSDNAAIGNYALTNNSTGLGNVGIGVYSLEKNTTGDRNSAVGVNTLKNNTGIRNTAFGADALINNITGDRNLALGYTAGSNILGSGNVVIGGSFGDATINETIIISTGTGAERIRINSSGNVGIGTATPTGLLSLAPKTTAAIKAIVAPAKGAIEFSSDANALCYFDGTAWQRCTTTAL